MTSSIARDNNRSAPAVGGSTRFCHVTEEDRPLLRSWLNHPHYLANVRSVSDSNGTEALIDRLIARPPEHEALLLVNNDKPRVLIELLWNDNRSGTVELDTLFDPISAVRGVGAINYLRSIFQYMFRERGFRKLYAFVYADNERSMRLMSRFFRHEATVPFPRGDDLVEAHVFGAEASAILTYCSARLQR